MSVCKINFYKGCQFMRNSIFLIISAIFLLTAAFSAPLHAADTSEISATAEIALNLPEVRDFKTAEACLLSVGMETESVSLGGANTPMFASAGPSSFAVDKKGNVYVLDAMNFKVLIVKEGRVIKVITYPHGESSDTKEAYFMRDIAISPKNNNIYLLNYTLKNIFVMSPTGEIKGEIELKHQISSPKNIFITNDDNIVVKDEGKFDVVVYSPEGKVLGREQGDEISAFADREGFLFAKGERDKNGQDIILFDPGAKRKNPKRFAKLIKVIKDTEPYDYQLLGVDAKGNFFASIIEKIREDVIQTIIYKFGPDGKTLARIRVMPMPLLEDTMPTRYFVISPKGEIYAYAANPARDKFAILKIE
ncbi:MAG: hypothetical protein A2008_11565 [Candidatus Wallbacteria bacterium GWC2_49_35]|uniref:6-bladed beta-propeller n=1 Tax=Candidatus Wallbacteria bacterium GWC2_49_35 TaxID=1817813 RepID=A0A1F7WTY2_9BACT|nr:MAG: hypothetical protein A2008_11565 [Candidatus Wallbacteria bacterium GWC2_49_35]HBC73877.1 hypothetical protein [Candidatus Wallbacteria bacterium]